MGWFKNLIKFKSPSGISLNFDGAWEVSSPKDFALFIKSLVKIMPVEAILYLEGTAITPRITKILESMECEPQAQVARGTIWPQSRCFHIPMSQENLNMIASLFEENASPEICDHFHVYSNNKVLLDWHDAFYDDPFLVDRQVPEDKLKSFSMSTNTIYKKAITKP
mgnify:FL=1